MSNPVTRNHTARFKELRAKHKPLVLGHPTGFGNSGSESLLDHQEDTGWGVPPGLATAALPPVWVDTFDQLNTTIQKIEQTLKRLERMQKDRLRNRFETDYSDQDREIEVMTATITGAIKKCQSHLKRIATIGNSKGDLPFQERAIRVNVMRAKATKVQSLSKHLRKLQKDFLTKLQGQRSKGSEFFDDDEPKFTLDDVNTNFSEAQLHAMAMREEEASDRQNQILTIAKNVNELSTIFNELNVLVVQQGTVLDRIDYNIEATLSQLKGAHTELKKAEKHQKKARSTMCIIVLLVLILIFSLILIFRSM